MKKLLLRLCSAPALTFAIILTALLIQSFFLSSQTSNFSPQAAVVSFPDFDGNGIVNFSDFLLFVDAFGFQEGQEKYKAKYDLDSDGKIALGDFVILTRTFGKTVNRVPVLILGKPALQTGNGGTNANGLMYWVDRGTDKIQRANLDGSNIGDLITTGLRIPTSIAIGGGKMYWVDRGTDKIQRADLDGDNIEDLITTGLADPRGIALDISGGKMYWVDRGTDKIQRADFNGNNIEDLIITGLADPRGIALDILGGKMY